jgi:hypothetical protein
MSTLNMLPTFPTYRQWRVLVFAGGCKERGPRLLDDKCKITQTQRCGRFWVVQVIYLDSHDGRTTSRNKKKKAEGL